MFSGYTRQTPPPRLIGDRATFSSHGWRQSARGCRSPTTPVSRFSGGDRVRRLAARRLIRVHRGVYAVGDEDLSDRGRCIAALLAAGDGATLSHPTALALWQLIPSMPQSIEVTLTHRRPRQRSGIKVHRAAKLETTVKDGLPVTTAPQALQGRGGPPCLEEALYRGLVTAPTRPSSPPIGLEQADPRPRSRRHPGTVPEHPIGPAESTSTRRTISSSSRPTAGRATATGRPSRMTGRATPSCMRTATRAPIYLEAGDGPHDGRRRADRAVHPPPRARDPPPGG